MLIIGEKEQEGNLVSVRKHGQGDLGQMTAEAFVQLLNNEMNQEINKN